MKILKNKKAVVILILLFGGFLCGCKNNSLDDVPDIEITGEEKVNEDYDSAPNVAIEYSTDENVDTSKGEDNANAVNNLLNSYRDVAD